MKRILIDVITMFISWIFIYSMVFSFFNDYQLKLYSKIELIFYISIIWFGTIFITSFVYHILKKLFLNNETIEKE